MTKCKPREKFSTEKAGKCRDTMVRDVVEPAFLDAFQNSVI